MRPVLTRAILQLYGESPVLDPMCGIGTTLIEAMLLGMNAIGIEYEKKFVNMANENIERVREELTLKKLGNAICLQGDARKLNTIFSKYHIRGKFGSIIFSPPYASALRYGGEDENSYGYRFAKQKRLPWKYSNDPENIGNLKNYSEELFNSIIFSPPYWNAIRSQVSNKKEITKRYLSSLKKAKEVRGRPISKALARGMLGYSNSKENIGNISEYCARENDSASYLSEMLKIYKECYKVLKSGKFMVVVVKDIRRKRTTIPLCADTINLIRLAGFNIFDMVISDTYYPSFWQLYYAIKNQQRNFPMTLRVHEYVIIARKSTK